MKYAFLQSYLTQVYDICSSFCNFIFSILCKKSRIQVINEFTVYRKYLLWRPTELAPGGTSVGGEYLFFTAASLLLICLVPGDALIIQQISDAYEGNWKGKE